MIWRGIRFSIVGAIAACVYFVLLYAMVEWLHVEVMVATAIGYLVTMLESYVLHHFWTFKSSQNHAQAFPKFIAMNAVGFILNWVIMYAAVVVMEFHYLLSQAMAIATIIAWNFLAGSLWVFKTAA